MVWPFTSTPEDVPAPKVESTTVIESPTEEQQVRKALPKRVNTRTMNIEEKVNHEEKRWLNSEIERKRVVEKLTKLHNELEKQNRELGDLVKETEDDQKTPKLRIGNLATLLLIQAEGRARQVGHRSVGTEDILWAMFHQSEKQESSAIQFLKRRGVTKESLFAKHKYSDNAGTILKLAAQRSSDLNKPVVGTEDLLWAMFQTDDHSHSRSQAIQHLAARGINMDLVWNQAELSHNSQEAIKLAVARAKESGHRIIGSEDLVEALFQIISTDEAAKHRNVRFYANHLSPMDLEDHEHNRDETVGRMFLVGGLAGVLETFIVQPLVYWKSMAQISGISGSALFKWQNLRPDVVYRGVLVNAGSIGPISAVQYGANGVISAFSKKILGPEISSMPVSTLMVAATTGALSSVVVTPAELFMISQQRSGDTLVQVAKQIWESRGYKGYFRGLGATAAREAGWTFGFLGLAPVIKSYLRYDSKFFNSNETAASMTSSVIAGQAAALLTQPADTIKTLLQADRGISSEQKFNSSFEAMKYLYKQPGGAGGIQAFWRGIVPRSTRCIMAVYILSEAQNKLSDVFDTYGILPNGPIEKAKGGPM